MKKLTTVVIAFSLAVSTFTIANAGFRNGMDGGCGDCAQQAGAPSDQFRKFQTDTIDLRQEMMTKRFEAQRENLKGTPDAAKISALQAEIKVIQTKIQDVRSKSGLPLGKSDGECGQRMGGFDKKGMGGCGKGQGGCNSGPCNQK